MSTYDREEKFKVILKGFKKLGLELKSGNRHITATCPTTQDKTTLPRHKTVSKFIVGSICEFLLKNGYSQSEIFKAFKW